MPFNVIFIEGYNNKIIKEIRSMFNKKIVKCLALTITCFGIMGASKASADEIIVGDGINSRVSVGYSFSLSNGDTGETSDVAKGQDNTGTNSVKTIGGKAKCWIENKSGSNVSTSFTYSTTGNKNMSYNKDTSRAKLNIQNVLLRTAETRKFGTTGTFHS